MRLKKKHLKFLPALFFTAIVALLSLLPSKEMQTIAWFNIPNFDKMVHLGMYFILAMLFVYSLENSQHHIDLRIAVIVFLMGILYGGLLEILQYLMHAGRSADWIDFSADCIGSLAGIIFYFPAKRYVLSKLSRKPVINP
jgi:VanZ family protein